MSASPMGLIKRESRRLSINKSLSALGDVIATLGEKGEKGNDKHIPYRNFKVSLFL
jgi:kinesin family member C1